MSGLKRLQLTLAVIKPDVSAHPHIVQEVRERLLSSGFYFVKSKQLRLTRENAEAFYGEHKGKFFYGRLVNFMSSGIINCHILARDNGIALWREMMGPTKVFRTIFNEPDSIRGQFGLTDTRNCTHGSDAEDTARKEIKFFFPEFHEKKWLAEEESYYRNNQVYFDEERCLHLIRLHPVDR